VVLVLFDLDLKSILDGLENKFIYIKKEERAYLCSWRPGNHMSWPAFPFSWVGRAKLSRSLPLASRGLAQEVAVARPSLLFR
jgi:hypothetical protein